MTEVGLQGASDPAFKELNDYYFYIVDISICQLLFYLNSLQIVIF